MWVGEVMNFCSLRWLRLYTPERKGLKDHCNSFACFLAHLPQRAQCQPFFLPGTQPLASIHSGRKINFGPWTKICNVFVAIR